jgi:hypothetical protein
MLLDLNLNRNLVNDKVMCLNKMEHKKLSQYTSSANTSFVFIAVSQKLGTPLAEK